MTSERDQDHDHDATVVMPRPASIDEELEDVDPEATLVREDWESTVIRRVAPRVAEVEANAEQFGWESKVLRHLSRELQRATPGERE